MNIDLTNAKNQKLAFDSNFANQKNNVSRPACYFKHAPIDVISFENKSVVAKNTKSSKQNSLIAFAGKLIHKKDLEGYSKDYLEYKNLSELQNRILYSYGDPSSMAQVIKDTQARLNKTKDEIFKDIGNKIDTIFDKLKSSPIIYVEGSKVARLQVLNNDRYTKIKDIYLHLLSRPEAFDRVEYDSKDQKLSTILTDKEIDEQSKEFKHILNDILPEVLKSKTIVVDDITDLCKILSDEVVQALVLDKLAEENNNTREPGVKIEEFEIQPEQIAVEKALKLLKNINNMFDITIASRVPKSLSLFGREEKAPEGYYNKSKTRIKEIPKNYYEAQYLKEVASKQKEYDPKNTVIVTPKSCAPDIVDRIKFLNKDYLFIEDWLYKYSLGDQETREKIVKNITAASEKVTEEEVRKITCELDNYINNFIEVYDIKNPENNGKLKELMQDYSKSVGMTEMSRGYFIGVGKGAKKLISLYGSIVVLSEVLKKICKSLDPGYLLVVAEILVSNSEDISDACQNYLTWKLEFGDKEARKMFEKTISHIITSSAPSVAMNIAVSDTPLKKTMIRHASTVSSYIESTITFRKYFEQTDNLVKKGIKEIPADIKDDPNKVMKWKVTETWKAYCAHAINKGEMASVILTQPFAILSTAMSVVGPLFGIGTLFLLFDQIFDSVVTNAYIMMDSANWSKIKNKIKKGFVEKKNGKITEAEFLEAKRSMITKLIESNAGQYGIDASARLAKVIPKKLIKTVKKVYMGLFNFVAKHAGKGISALCIKRIEKKDQKRKLKLSLNPEPQNNKKIIA